MLASEAQALGPGTIIDSFQIESVLGVGGFGITYRARDLSLQRPVALKEYFPSGLAARREGDTTLEPRTTGDLESYSYGLRRFLDEARTLAKFQDRNIVRVNSYVKANGTAYLVMDYEEGRTLADVLQQTRTLSPRQALAVAVHILRGLRSVHDKGILHRDIKPANVLVRRSGPPVLLDFGAARQALERRAGDVTVMLTPGYAPIEQYGGEDRLGPWSDIYALGATVYHALTGRAPLASTERVTASHAGETDPVVANILARAEEIGPTLTDALPWMLEMSANARPQSASELLDLLLPGRVPTAGGTAGGSTGDYGPMSGLASTRGAHHPPSRGAVAPDEAPTRVAPQPAVGPVHAPEVLEAAEKALAEYLGPIAKVLVERAARTTRGADQLYTALAEELDDEDERRGFLASRA